VYSISASWQGKAAGQANIAVNFCKDMNIILPPPRSSKVGWFTLCVSALEVAPKLNLKPGNVPRVAFEVPAVISRSKGDNVSILFYNLETLTNGDRHSFTISTHF